MHGAFTAVNSLMKDAFEHIDRLFQRAAIAPASPPAFAISTT